MARLTKNLLVASCFVALVALAFAQGLFRLAPFLYIFRCRIPANV